jgi:hypothetical protein
MEIMRIRMRAKNEKRLDLNVRPLFSALRSRSRSGSCHTGLDPVSPECRTIPENKKASCKCRMPFCSYPWSPPAVIRTT